MKEDYIRKLESSILEQKEINARQHNEIKVLNERLNSESRRIKSLEREDDRLRSEIAILESKVRFLNIKPVYVFFVVFWHLYIRILFLFLIQGIAYEGSWY